ncbi:hypothetical protein NDA10_000985 [Ustilago hordei]|nr:hypothetical protein NDA10_000985 [Ustilago hordei]
MDTPSRGSSARSNYDTTLSELDVDTNGLVLNKDTQPTSAHPNAPRSDSIDTSAGAKASKHNLRTLRILPSIRKRRELDSMTLRLSQALLITQQTTAHPRPDSIDTSADSKDSKHHLRSNSTQ